MSGHMRSRTAVSVALAFGLVAAGITATAAHGQSGLTGTPVSAETVQQQQTLRELADQRGVRMGAAVAEHRLNEQDYSNAAAAEFNSVTHENSLKWESVQPQQGQYSFDGADNLVNFAESNGQDIHGHTLVWHSQLPSWVENSGFGPEELLAVMDDHISTTMGRYEGQIDTWDVANEVIGDDANWRNSVFYEQLGEDFVAEALHMARDADPNARLFINDYSIDGINAKSDVYYDLAVDLLDQGAPLDGIGLQAHLIVGQVPGDMRQNIQRFADLGLEVMITELDVRVPTPATEADLQRQAEDYREVFEICLEVSGCSGVTVWGVTDAYSWVPEHFEGEGAALPLDDNYNPKPAYWAIHEALGGTGGGGEPTDPPTEEPTDPPAGDCSAEYTLVSDWGSGYQGEVTVTAGADLTGWTVSWPSSGGTIDQVWNANVTESGGQVTATNVEHNGTLSAGGAATFGFIGSNAPSGTPDVECAAS